MQLPIESITRVERKKFEASLTISRRNNIAEKSPQQVKLITG
jgi:hypothetical protein